MEPLLIDWHQLFSEAVQARLRAHAPYSQFAVGAALLAANGRVYHGCNVENASFGATNCAERTALFSAIANAELAGSFVALAVVADTEHPITPCGLCRQVMSELCSADMPVMMANLQNQRQFTTVGALLPYVFDSKQLFSKGTDQSNGKTNL